LATFAFGSTSGYSSTDEGEPAPDGSGESSGFVIDQDSRTFFFVVRWSAGQCDVALTEWLEVPAEPGWGRSVAYRRARVAAGLGEE
jgi:hypothetical protein